MTDDPEWRNTITVSKFDVARRQLATAISLWFNDGDPISIHTLAYASHEILHRLYKAKGFKDLLFDTSAIKDEYRSEYAKMLKENGAFFKHADRDMDAKRDFMLGRNFIFILMTVIGISRMEAGRELGDEETVFLYWCRVHHPEWFDPTREKNPIQQNELAKLGTMSKSELFAYILAARTRARERGDLPS